MPYKSRRVGAGASRGGGGKKTTELTVEQDQEVKRILERVAHARQVDLEAWETALRVAVLSAGASALGGVIEGS